MCLFSSSEWYHEGDNNDVGNEDSNRKKWRRNGKKQRKKEREGNINWDVICIVLGLILFDILRVLYVK